MIAGDLAQGETGHVLVVDDNPANRYLLTQWLRRAGHEVTEAGDGGDAIEKLGLLAGAPSCPKSRCSTSCCPT